MAESNPLVPPQAALDALREDWPEYVEYWEEQRVDTDLGREPTEVRLVRSNDDDS